MKTVIKLTDKNLQTHGGCQWVVGEWKKTAGNEKLCRRGWLHAYDSAGVAAFMNPIHANFKDPIFWCAEVSGKTLNNNGLNCGWTEMRLVTRVAPTEITVRQRIEIAIRCATIVCNSEAWRRWAGRWLDGSDRSQAASESEAAESESEAAAEAEAAEAAWAAERAAAWAAERAAAWAAESAAAAWAEDAAEARAKAEWAAAWAAESAAAAAAERGFVFDLSEIIKTVLKERNETNPD
jgi:hypothetical protein